jgi:hypothetical protein
MSRACFGYERIHIMLRRKGWKVNRKSREFKVPWDQIANVPPRFHGGRQRSEDTEFGHAYSWLGLDLRAEPIMLTVPAMAG